MNQQALLAWYQQEKRDLPFRAKRDPYAIWISEIMSQQTRIEAMLGHYVRFMELFPDIPSLAKADDDALMKAWQGLGYYSRARNLKKAAQVCVREHDGKLPDTYEQLCRLPGIGDYTAGAVASIAFGRRVPAIDGNVIRVYARFCWLEEDFTQTGARRRLRERVMQDLPDEEFMPSWTQALMELGARICQPSRAQCRICPLKEECAGARMEDPCVLPLRRKKMQRRIENHEVILQAAWSEAGWKLRIRRRPARGLLAGLYEFGSERPQIILEQADLGEHIHIFTHREWHMHGWLMITEETEDFVLMEVIEQKNAIPSAFAPFYSKAVRYLNEKTGENGSVRSGRNASL